MRISAFPKGELDDLVAGRLSVEAWIDRAARLPLDGVELYGGIPGIGSPDSVRRLQDQGARLGIAYPMLCVSPDFTHPDPDRRRQEFDRQLNSMELARALGGAGASCRVLSGQRHPGVGTEQGLDWAAEAITALLPVAAELEIVLAIENHYKDGFWTYPEFARSVPDFLALLERIPGSPWFGVQYDPSNALLAGADSADFLDQVIDRVVTMQASDRHLVDGATLDDLARTDDVAGYSALLAHGVLGEGLNDYPRIFATLVEHGYDGWISIEDGVNGWDDLTRSAEFLVDARERYFGGSTAVSVRARLQAEER